MPTYHIELSVNHPKLSFPQSSDCSELPLIQTWGEKAMWQEFLPRAFGPLPHITALYLQKFLYLSLTHTTCIWWWSAAVHVQLYCAFIRIYPIYDGQLRSLGNLTPVVNHLFCAKGQRPKTTFEKESSYPQRMARISLQILRVCMGFNNRSYLCHVCIYSIFWWQTIVAKYKQKVNVLKEYSWVSYITPATFLFFSKVVLFFWA